MKKVKTLLSIFFCIMASALFGACSCSQPNVSVVAIKVSGVSDNVHQEEGSGKYLVRKGETFTITYEVMPENASDFTTYIELTPANRISTDSLIIRSKEAKNEITFKASSTNIGETLIEFQTKDGGETASLVVEIIDDAKIFSEPTKVRYEYNPHTQKNEFVWDKSTVETNNGLVDAERYLIMINDDKFETSSNSYPMELESGVDYYVRVQALGELKNRTTDSPITNDIRFYIANTPTNLKANDGLITWNYEDEANINNFILEFSSYKVMIPDVTRREFNLKDYIARENITGIGNFTVKLTAVNTDFVNGAPNDGNIMTHIMNSRNNPTLSLTQLYAPTNVRLNNQREAGDIYTSSILEWDRVTSATSYMLTITKNGQELGQIINNANYINLSKAEFVRDSILSQEMGSYSISITAQGDSKNSFSQNDAIATYDFVVTPFLYGSVNYNTDNLNLLTADLLSLLGLTTDGLASNIKYEIYYSENVTGNYENVITVNNPTTSISLNSLINMDSAYNILVRPVVTGTYTTKNVVVPMLREINFNKSISGMISQLKPVTISGIDTEGVISATDINASSTVESYRFELTGDITATQTIYRDNPNLSFTENVFTVSLVQLFNITEEGNYNIKIIPTSSKIVDANISACNNYNFKQLGFVDTATIEIDNNVITWDSVQNYSSYSIKINSEDAVVVDSNRYVVEDPTILEDNNTISIVVNGNGTSTISGKSVSITKPRASVVSGFRVEGGVLTWDDSVANSTYYITITYPEENVENIVVNTNSYSGLDKIATSATITISRGVPTEFNSAESSEIVLERLTTPTNDMVIVDHTKFAEFSLVDNASSYNIVIKKGAATIKSFVIDASTPDVTVTTDKIRFKIDGLDPSQYSVYVQAIPSDQDSTDYTTNSKFYLISGVSNNNDFVVYPQIEITNKTHTLNWSFASTYEVKDYTIHFVNDEYADIVLTGTSYDFADVLAGTYELTISASSTAVNVIYSDAITVTVVKTETPTIAYNDGKVVFTVVDTASEYKVYDSNDNLLVNNTDYRLTIDANTAYITPLRLQEGVTYSIYIVAIGDTDIIDGDASSTVEFSIISGTSGFALNNKVFTWNSVSGNDGYEVILKKGTEILETTIVDTESYTIPAKYFSGADLFEAGEYQLSVVVMSNTLLNSNPASVSFVKLGLFSDANLDGNTITWSYTGEGTPSAYELTVFDYISDTWEQVEKFNVVNVYGVDPTFDLTQLSAYDDYMIKIKCIGNDSAFTLDGEVEKFVFKYGENDEYDRDRFTKIDAPTFTYANGKLQLVVNAEASSYEVYSYNGTDYTKLTYEYSFDAEMYLDLSTTATEYQLAVKAIAADTSGKLNSVYSTIVKVNKLATITDFAVDGSGLLTWTADEHANGYVVHNLTTGQSTPISGQATNSVSYDYLYTAQGLELGTTNEFVIQVVGDTIDGVNYLNSGLSNSVTINAISQISSIQIENGLVSWDDIPGVNSYKLDIIESSSPNRTLKSLVVNNNSCNINGFTEIANGSTVKVKIIPYSTESNNFIIVDSLNATEMVVSRYNVITAISVENGLIKFQLDISKVTYLDMLAIINATDYTTLSEEIQQKYYGYYNFNINIVGGDSTNITLNDMAYTIDAVQIASGIFYATYQLGYNVQSTTLLNIQITSIGNKGNNALDYNALSSIPSTSNKTILSAYKHAAPRPAANDNLIGENGEIIFKKINNVDKYILTAKSVSQTPETLYYIVNTSLSAGMTYNVGNLSTINFTIAGTSDTKKVDGDTEYIYTLTTLGTESGNAGDLYLRSNPYKTTSVTFLSTPTFSYVYDGSNINGGYVSWTDNPMALSYRIYALNTSESNYLEHEKENIRNTTAWLDNSNVYMCDIPSGQTTYKFEDGGFYRGEGIDLEENVNLRSGYYWVAIKAIGDNVNSITPVGGSNTHEVYKLNPIVSQKLENGTFYWEVEDSDASFVTGFKIVVSVFTDGVKGATSYITKPVLIPIQAGQNVTYSYTLEESIIDNGTTHTLTGVSSSGGVEAYGVSIMAVGGNVNARQCVNSAFINIDNDDFGYNRLDPVVLDANADSASLEWTAISQNIDHLLNYTLFVNGNEEKTFDNLTNALAFSDALFNVAGDYSVEIKAMAKLSSYLNALKSNTITVVKFNEPVLTTEDGVIVWNNENNALAHQPISSTLIINSSDGSNNIAEVHRDTHTEFTFALTNSQTYPAGYYNVSVRYDGYDAGDTFYIASNFVNLMTYKLDIPEIEDVYNFLVNNPADRECPEYDSCIKWEIVKDENGEDVIAYQIDFYIYNGYDYVIDTTLTTTIPNINNPSYNSLVVVKDDYVYYNISDLGSNPNVTAGVQIKVTALGETNVLHSKYQLNSSQSVKEIDFSDDAPNVDSSDRTNGIIRWSGSDNPVYITLQYGEIGREVTENIHLDADYIARNGKVYYLPYMTRYKLVEIRFVKAGCYLGNTTEIKVVDQTLFASGDGTAANPYIIEDQSQLTNIRFRPLSNIKIKDGLTTLTLSSSWQMIDTFGGVLDGNGVAIKSIALGSVTENITGNLTYVYAALFKNVLNGSVIKNMTLQYSTSVGYSSTPHSNPVFLAGIAINNAGTINNVKLTGTMTTFTQSSVYHGGVAVYNTGTIRNIASDNITLGLTSLVVNLNSNPTAANLNSAEACGGGVVYENSGVLDFCNYSGTLNIASCTARIRRAGGMAISNSGVILNSEFTGTLKAYDMVGIAVENNYSSATFEIEKTYLVSEVPTTETYDYSAGSILGCYSNGLFVLPSGQTNKDIFVAGIVGRNKGGIIGRCYAIIDNNNNMDFTNTRSNSAYVYIGGLVALNDVHSNGSGYDYPVIENSYTIVTARFNEASGFSACGSLVGGYVSTIGTGINFGTDYCMKNLAYSSSYKATSNASISNMVATSLSSAGDLTSETYKTKLNTVEAGDEKYVHIREFDIVETTLNLKLTKTIYN